MPITPIPVSVSNPTGTVVLSASGLPAGLTFTDNGNGTGDITGTVAAGEALNSPFTVTITATDDVATDGETFSLTVEPPALTPYAEGPADPTALTKVVDDSNYASLLTGVSFAFATPIGHNLLLGLDFQGSTTVKASVLDVTDPVSPVVINDAQTLTVTNQGIAAHTTAVDVANEKVYVCYMTGSSSSALLRLDVSNPAAITIDAGPTGSISSGGIGGVASNVVFSGSFVAASGKSQTVMKTKVFSPDLVNEYADLTALSTTDTLRGMAAKGNNLWTYGTDGLEMWDFASPYAPVRTNFTNSEVASNPPYKTLEFLPGTAQGDILVMTPYGTSTSLLGFPATGSEAAGAAPVKGPTGLGAPATSSSGYTYADTLTRDGTLYSAQSPGLLVTSCFGTFTRHGAGYTTPHGVSWVAVVDGKVFGGDGAGRVTVWT